MINQKMLALGSKRSVIRETFEYGNRRKIEIGSENVFDFSLGNPNVPTPLAVTETLKKLVLETDPCKLHAYTSASGDHETKRMIADYTKKTHNFKADADLIYVTCGAASSLTISLGAVLNEGDEVVALAPYFPEYKVFVEASGGALRVVPPAPDFSLNVAGLEASLNEKTKAVIINSPNNPTGAVLSEADVSELSRLLKEKSRLFDNPIYLISDEPYRELVYDGIFVPYIPNYYENTLVCYSFSKSLSLAGERIGYILVSPKAENATDIYNAICGAGRALGYVCAPSLFQRLIAKVLGKTADLEAYDRNRILLYETLTELGFEVIKPQGAFYLFVKAPNGDATLFCDEAKKEELLFVPSDDFGVSGYVRISYCVSHDTIQRSLPAFKRLALRYFSEV